MNSKFLAIGALTFGMLLGSCSSDDDNNPDNVDKNNLELSIEGLGDLGSDFKYEGWIIVDGAPVSTGLFTVDGDGKWSQNSFEVDKEDLEKATKFVLSIEPTVDPKPEPSATKILTADFNGDTAEVTANVIPGIKGDIDGDFTSATGKYFLKTPTDAIDDNDESGIWFGVPGGPPTPGFTGMEELDEDAGWRYEGWVVVPGVGPISTGTFTKFDTADSGNPFSGTLAGPQIPGEDFLSNAPTGVTFPLDLTLAVNDNDEVQVPTVVISLEPFPDNSPAPFEIKPLATPIGTETATPHDFGDANLGSFPSGTITRK